MLAGPGRRRRSPLPGAIAAAQGEPGASRGPDMATDSWALAVDEQEAAAESVSGAGAAGPGAGAASAAPEEPPFLPGLFVPQPRGPAAAPPRARALLREQ